MNAIHAIRESVFCKGAEFFLAITLISLTVSAVALAIFYSSFMALKVATLSFKAAQYAFVGAGGAFIIASVFTALNHLFVRVQGRVDLLRAPPASVP